MAKTPGIDKVLGTILVGTWLNSILFTLEFLEVIRYYRASKRNQDSRWLQGMVYFTLLVDTISTFGNCACVYFYTITRWGDPHYLEGDRFWASVTSLVTIWISETIVQLFLIYRYYRMSENKYITLILVLLVLAEFGGSLETIRLFVITTFLEGNLLVAFGIIWFSLSAATDTAIAVALIWQFSRIKSPFKSTQSLIRKLVVATIRTGAVTSVVVLLSLVLFVNDTESNASMTFGFCLGRVYALTMLYNLNSRGSHIAGTTNTSGYREETCNSMTVTKSVHVHTTGLSTTQEPRLSDSQEVFSVEKTATYP